MSAHVNLRDAGQRPIRYWHIDGLPELLMGLMWMIWGGSWLFGQTLPHTWIWSVYWFVVPLALASSGFFTNRILQRLKLEVTAPRTGYVAMKEPSHANTWVVGAAVALGFLGVIAAINQYTPNTPVRDRLIAPIVAVGLCLAFLFQAWRQGASHYFALAMASLALGYAAWNMSSGWEGLNWLFVGLGALCALFGGVRFHTYLKDNPLPVPEGE